MKKVSLSVLFLCVVLVLPAFAERPLRIVFEEWAPFEFVDAKGAVVGIDIDITRKIFKKMGVEVEYLALPWDTAWKMIEEGRADASLSTSRKESRLPFANFATEDMWTGEFVFFARKDAMATPVKSYKDAKGKSVVIVTGNAYDDSFTNAGLTTVESSSLKNQFKKVASKKADLALAEKTVGLYSLKLWKMDGVVGVHDHVLYKRGYLMPFSKKSDYPGIKAIADRFAAELKLLKASGEYDAIRASWIK